MALPRMKPADDPRKMRPGTYTHPHMQQIKLRVHPTGKRSWFIRTRVAGRQEYVDLGDVSTADAYSAAVQALQAAKGGVSPREQRALDAQRKREAHEADRAHAITFADVRADLFASPGFLTIRKPTLQTYRWSLHSDHVKHLANRAIRTITRKDIERIESALRQAGHPTTAGTVLRSLRRLFLYAKAHGHLDRSPLDGYKVAAAAPRAQPLSPAELKATLTAISRYERENQASLYPDLWRVLLYTGLRPGAVEKLEWRDVDLRKATLTVRAENAKLNAQFTVPIARCVVQILQKRSAARPDYRDRLQRESNLCFPSRTGRPLWKPVREIVAIDTLREANRHGWPHFRPQRFRDTFISWAENHGVNYIDLCRLVGWRVPGVMRNYSASGDIERLRSVVEARAKAIE